MGHSKIETTRLEAKNEEEAIRKALEKMPDGTFIDKIEVMEKGTGGFMGIGRSPNSYQITMHVADIHYNFVENFLGHTAVVRCISFSPNGQYLASGSVDCNINVYKTLGLEKVRVLQGHTKVVESIAFSPDNKLLASSSEDKSVNFWSITDWILVQTYGWKRFLGLDTFGVVFSVVFSSDGQFLYMGKSSGLEKWKVVTGVDVASVGKDKFKSENMVALYSPDLETSLSAIAVSADNRFVANGSEWYSSFKAGRSREHGTRVKLYRSIDAIESFSGHPGFMEKIITPGPYVRSLSFSSDGNLMAFTHRGEDIRVRKINSDAQQYTGVEELDMPSFVVPKSEGRNYPKSIAFSPDGQLLGAQFTSGELIDNKYLRGGNILIWKVMNRELVQVLQGNYTCFCFSPDSKLIAAGAENGSISIYAFDKERSSANNSTC